MRLLIVALCLSIIALSPALYAEDKASSVGAIAASADETTPLSAGASAPEAALQNEKGEAVTLKETLDGKPAIVVFYRGSWCPHCMVHLQALQGAYDDFAELGFTLIAISPNTPEKLAETEEKLKAGYTLLSDSKMEAMKGFGVAFKLDAATVEKYKGYGIDLEAANGNGMNALPVPAIFILDAEGKISFTHANPDYKQRLDTDSLVAEAKKAAGN